MRTVSLLRCGAVLLLLSAAGLGVLAQSHCTITVQPGESIQAAVDSAPEGAVICLAEGEWEEDLAVTRSVTLRGSGVGRTRIKGQEVGWWPVIEIGDSREIEVWIEGIAIEEGNNGIWVRGSSRVQLSSVAVEGNRQNGITIWDLADVTIVGSTVATSRQHGLAISDSASVIITDSTIMHNGWSGIEGRGSAQVILSDSTVTGNGECGLFLQGASEITIRESTVRSAVLGIGVSETAHAVIAGSLIEGGESGGIYLEDTAHAMITVSTIAGGESLYGITIVGTAQASITHSVIADHWLHGISVWNSATVSIANSDVHGNTYGIVLSGSAHATLVGNEISGNRQYGVALHEAPCFGVDTVFSGYVAGQSNRIPSLLEIGGNRGGAFCSRQLLELGFLTTSRGGALDRR